MQTDLVCFDAPSLRLSGMRSSCLHIRMVQQCQVQLEEIC